MPEPTSVLLLSSGIGGIMIRYARAQFIRLKRALDVLFVVLTGIITVPLIGILALLTKWTSHGPALYAQERVGLNGKIFKLYKFRSMRIDAEKGTGPVWATVKDDPRVTAFGKFLRKSHLDELPQLWNVLIGDMSIIGPRPERPFFVDKLTKELPDYQKRLEIKPGITGLAQVLHKADESMDDVKKKLHYDLVYIRKASWWTDFYIAFRTGVKMLAGERYFSTKSEK